MAFAQGDITDLSAYKSDAWDVVYSVYVFQYVVEIQQCLDECARLLKPGGRLVCLLPHSLFANKDYESFRRRVEERFGSLLAPWQDRVAKSSA